MNTDELTVREAARRRIPLDGANAQALEGALSMTERERDEARAEVEVLRRERDDLHGAVMLAEERGAEWAIRAKAQVVYSLAGDASYVMLAKEVCEQARADFANACDVGRRQEARAEKAERERDEAHVEVERLRVIIQEWSYPRLYVQPGVERETLLAQLQENLVNKVRPSIEAAEERGAKWALERHGNPFAEKTLAQYAEEICRDARGKR